MTRHTLYLGLGFAAALLPASIIAASRFVKRCCASAGNRKAEKIGTRSKFSSRPTARSPKSVRNMPDPSAVAPVMLSAMKTVGGPFPGNEARGSWCSSPNLTSPNCAGQFRHGWPDFDSAQPEAGA